MSPIVTGTASAPGLASSFSAMCGDSSNPHTEIPRPLSGSATRPVPTANSRAGPPCANSASRSTVGLSTGGSNIAEYVLSYTSAMSSPQVIEPINTNPLVVAHNPCSLKRPTAILDCTISPASALRRFQRCDVGTHVLSRFATATSIAAFS